jgi:hypothetical protein
VLRVSLLVTYSNDSVLYFRISCFSNTWSRRICRPFHRSIILRILEIALWVCALCLKVGYHVQYSNSQPRSIWADSLGARSVSRMIMMSIYAVMCSIVGIDHVTVLMTGCWCLNLLIRLVLVLMYWFGADWVDVLMAVLRMMSMCWCWLGWWLYWDVDVSMHVCCCGGIDWIDVLMLVGLVYWCVHRCEYWVLMCCCVDVLMYGDVLRAWAGMCRWCWCDVLSVDVSLNDCVRVAVLSWISNRLLFHHAFVPRRLNS